MKFSIKEKKQFPASSQIILFIFILGFLIFYKSGMTKKLSIVDQNTSEVYFSASIKESDTITFGWIHSLEHIPWTEEYIVLSNNNLLLKKITFPAFGAGIPHNRGKVTKIENDLIIMDEIDEEFSEISWIHSKTATDYIMINDQIIINGEELPHHIGLKLKIEKRLSLWTK